MKPDSLVLVDAYSQIFRSFYAIRMLTNSRNEPVNAAYVFTKLLLQLEKNHPSKYGAMLFDCGKVAFRMELNPEYKANRPPMPDPLKQQIPLIRKIAGAFGWKQLQCPDYEADDLIGGFAAQYPDKTVEIVSSDKDLSQLIDQRVTMLIPASGGFERRGVAEVVEKFGVTPAEMVDYLALLGDSSDNIPGVPGVGAKSAVEILKTFGAAEKWLDDPALIDPAHKLGKKLLPELETVRRNRELIRLRTGLPAEMATGVPPLRDEPDWHLIADICRDNQFNSILKELPELPAEPEHGDFEDDLFSFAAAQKPVVEEKKAVIEIQDELF
ncbi:MAG: hypothetical protein E7058_03255 [Lentisphaerae bacterium]|nr:hypothetical protein [Lentisphaerota bacterium]